MRDKSLLVRVTAEELAAIREAASRAGMKQGTFIRQRALGWNGRPATADRRETVRQIARIGNNLNQIARAMNTEAKMGQPIDLVTVAALLKSIDQGLADVLQSL
jgi:mobilization protein NikA